MPAEVRRSECHIHIGEMLILDVEGSVLLLLVIHVSAHRINQSNVAANKSLQRTRTACSLRSFADSPG